MVAGAIVVGALVSVWASSYGVKLELNNFAKSLFYYLFMYGVGLRVGPSFINSLKGDGLKFTFLAVVSSVLGLALVVIGAKLFDLPPGAAGGMLAGSQTMSAAIGSAEQAITSGVVKLPAGMKPEEATGMIALSYGITYIWGTVGIILICKYLPRWWGVDAQAAAKKYEEEFGVRDLEGGGLTGYPPVRPARLPAGKPCAGRPDDCRIPQGQSRIPHRQRVCAAANSWGPIRTSCCRRATSLRSAARPSI